MEEKGNIIALRRRSLDFSLRESVLLFLGDLGSVTKQGWRYPGWNLLLSRFFLSFGEGKLLVGPENCMCT